MPEVRLDLTDAAELAEMLQFLSSWLARDPLTRLEAYLRAAGLLDDDAARRLAAEAERFADSVRERMNIDAALDPAELFAHVYARPTAALEHQRAALLSDLEDAGQ